MSNDAELRLTRLYQHRAMLETLLAQMDTEFTGLHTDVPKLSKTEKASLAVDMEDILYGLNGIGTEIKKTVSDMYELVSEEAA